MKPTANLGFTSNGCGLADVPCSRRIWWVLNLMISAKCCIFKIGEILNLEIW